MVGYSLLSNQVQYFALDTHVEEADFSLLLTKDIEEGKGELEKHFSKVFLHGKQGVSFSPSKNHKIMREPTVQLQKDVGKHLCHVLACNVLQKYA
jgi:hypothetical protein